MRNIRFVIIVILLSIIAIVSMPVMASQGDLGREILLPNDGWAAFSTGTTGVHRQFPLRFTLSPTGRN
jgi:hypothetical protein